MPSIAETSRPGVVRTARLDCLAGELELGVRRLATGVVLGLADAGDDRLSLHLVISSGPRPIDSSR